MSRFFSGTVCKHNHAPMRIFNRIKIRRQSTRVNGAHWPRHEISVLGIVEIIKGWCSAEMWNFMSNVLGKSPLVFRKVNWYINFALWRKALFRSQTPYFGITLYMYQPFSICICSLMLWHRGYISVPFRRSVSLVTPV